MTADPIPPHGSRPLRVVQVLFHADGQRRDPDNLLDAWPTLPATTAAVARTGIDIAVVHASHQAATIQRDGVTFHFVDDLRAMPARIVGPVRFRRRPVRILERIRALEPDVVHVHDLSNPITVKFVAEAIRGVPVLAQDHGVLPPRGWRRHAWRWALSGVHGVAFTAREQARAFVDARVFAADVPVFEVLPASSPFTPGDRAAARRITGIGGDPCFLWTTHLDANKDPLMALDAFERAAATLGAARLWLAFLRAPLLDAVRRRIASSPVLRERVHLLGGRPHDQMEAVFRSADFFVQTSRVEASGRSLLDALACGVTPLVTDIPAWRRMVGAAGSLTPVGDAAALARAMIDWAGRDRDALRRAARAHFDAALTYDAIGRELRAAYEALAATSARAASAGAVRNPRGSRRG